MSSKQQAIEFFMSDIEYFDERGLLNSSCISKFGLSLEDYVAKQRYTQIRQMNRNLRANFRTLASIDDILVDN